jgi:hypothetical protein
LYVDFSTLSLVWHETREKQKIRAIQNSDGIGTKTHFSQTSEKESDNTKQWPLDSEFIEFEYSPEICHFWRIRVLAKMTLFENGSDSLNLSTFANLVCSDSPDSTTFAKPFCKDSPDSRKASFA